MFGYAYVPPTPFHLKDWERYDVSRYVDPGCVSPEEGRRSVPVPEHEVRRRTIRDDLETLVKTAADLSDAIFLFHTPPYRTKLDRAALDGKMIDHAPLDVHVGSIAVERFIRDRQPLLTLHGHVHESTRITGAWRDRMGRTEMFNAAHHGPELALVRFDTEDLPGARDAGRLVHVPVESEQRLTVADEPLHGDRSHVHVQRRVVDHLPVEGRPVEARPYSGV